jgi:serine/threonine protein kinase
MNKVEFSEIKGAVKIGGGSQANIYKIPAGSLYKTAVALKKYKNKHLSSNETAIESYLDELISIKNRMSDDHKRILDQYTTWPIRIIYENGKACGYVMHLIPDMFFTNIGIPLGGTEKVPSSLDFILHGSKFRADNNLPRITDKGMARIVFFLLQVLAVIHEENIILGDLSPSNVLMYIDNQKQSDNRTLFIDTDSFRILGNTHPLKQLHSPCWIPPECKQAEDELASLPNNVDSNKKLSLEISAKIQTKLTDVYKVCLAITRLYHESEHSSSIILSTSAQEKLAKKISVEFSDKILSGLSDNPKQRPTINILYECLINALYSKVK